jgi:hypothetical protein
MTNNGTPQTTDDDDWDKDFEGGLTLRSPQITPSSSSQIPSLPPLSPKKTTSSPRKLFPPKVSTGNISDDNSKTIRPAILSKSSQSVRKVSVESSTSSNGNTMRAVSVSPIPLQHRVKPAPKISTGVKKRSRGRRNTTHGDLSDDGYEDLIKGDESKFVMKVNSLKVLSPL